jgi:diketogulonate reductase-like aldo/keto reductase
MREAQSHLECHALVANQVEYSLLDQKPKMDLLPHMQAQNCTLIAYRPLGRGILARPGNEALDEVAEKYGKSQAQVALNWLISQDKVLAIPKTSNPVHLLDIVGAIGWELGLEDSIKLAQGFI